MAFKTKVRLKAASDSYLKLVRTFPLASIKSDEHLHEAQNVMDRLRHLMEAKVSRNRNWAETRPFPSPRSPRSFRGRSLSAAG